VVALKLTKKTGKKSKIQKVLFGKKYFVIAITNNI
jgi:hypothetical protein